MLLNKLIGKLRYIEIIEEINSGGTSKIYLGINTHTGYRVAVKELNSNLFMNENIRNLFIGEANRYLYLDHPNIVKLEDLFLLEQEETGYLVMEYIEGKNLKEYIRAYGPLPYQNAAILIIEALKAIDFAHKRDVVHNDIKPSNIMLSELSEIKVIDFGISIDLKTRLDVENMFTPYYASPEQTIPGMDVDHRTDIYSMGISLYELVSGNTPFANRGLDKTQLKYKIRTEPVPYLKSYQSYDLPFEKKLNQIISIATMKDRDNRYQTCEEFIEDLSEIIN